MIVFMYFVCLVEISLWFIHCNTVYKVIFGLCYICHSSLGNFFALS